MTQEESVVPDTQEYITASGKEVLRLAAELVPLPLLKDVLGAAIKIIEVCEVSTNTLRVQSKMKEPTIIRTPQLLKRSSGNCRNTSKRT